MTFRNFISLITLSALSGLPGAAQFIGGGVGGFGSGGSAGRFGGLGGSSGSSTRQPKASWRPWVSVTGNYVDNPLYIDDAGNVASAQDQRGMTAAWGVGGEKQWENTSLFAGYSGSTWLTSQSNSINGFSSVVSLGANHRFNRNLYAGVQQIFGSTLGGYGVGSGFAGIGSGPYGFSGMSLSSPGAMFDFGNPRLNSFVDEELFNNRVHFSGTAGTLGYQLSLRSMLSVSGMAQFARRTNQSLSDLNSYLGSASYSYALNRDTSVGLDYSIGRFNYPNRFGGNRVQSLGVSMGRRFGERASLSGGAGATYFNSSFIGVVPLDPDLAESLGIPGVTQVQTARRLTWGGGLAANYRSDIAVFSLTAQRGMVPGNGILYGSVRDIIAFSAGRSFIDSRLAGTLNASLSRNSGIIQSVVQIRYQSGVWLSYRVGAGIFLTAGGGLRWHQVVQSGPYLPSKFATVGLGWSPGDHALFF